jgi:hypothetical protein
MTFLIAVLLRLARLNERQPHPVRERPAVQIVSRERAFVVAHGVITELVRKSLGLTVAEAITGGGGGMPAPCGPSGGIMGSSACCSYVFSTIDLPFFRCSTAFCAMRRELRQRMQ